MNTALVFKEHENEALKIIDELGLTTEGDSYDKEEDVARAMGEYDFLLGSLDSLNDMLSDGVVIDFVEYEAYTKKRWILHRYIEARMEE